jgi:Taurine catabolism dioxygenase TauD, TfdA family
MALDMHFAEGDMQFLKNSVILHGRTDYEDAAESDEKRHLLRLWLTAKSFRDGDDAQSTDRLPDGGLLSRTSRCPRSRETTPRIMNSPHF